MDSDDVRRQWAERSGEYSPEYYAYYGPNETSESLRELTDRYVGREASVLELGCSAGRHLAHLHDHGYGDLTGIEINDDALDVMTNDYPELATDGTFHFDAIEDVVVEFDDDRFDAVYSVQTLQHIHPDDEWVFAELARITADLLITVENEGDGGSDADTTSEVDGEGAPEVVGEGTSEADDKEITEVDGESGAHGVNYVNDEFPLYYRNWNRVFTDLGLDEVDAWTGERNTTRAFRAADE